MNITGRLYLQKTSLSFRLKLILTVLFFSLHNYLLYGQYNIDQLIIVGRSALYYEDYVLSIQYFNQAISAKPYLYEPWFFRGVAKFYLDDYAGAENDCTQAIVRNPYVVNSYELRGLCRIHQQKYREAVDDYTKALKYDPENLNLWHNRVLCHVQDSAYEQAQAELDTIVARWSHYAKGYSMRGEVYLLQKDTAQAINALDMSLHIDPYDGNTWAERSIISLQRQEWSQAEEFLSKAIHLLPHNANFYVNRALSRYNQNNLRGAMADYDTAIDFDPNNFLGHYNRGLLRAQVGDDNRGIEDFDFVLKLEPDNLMARFNRGLLRDKTGDVRGAIDDYSLVIEQYPNFWTGLQNRASCYRRLGMTHQAELDEFRILKAQIDKRYGRQQRSGKRKMRKRSDEDMDKYNQLVVADKENAEPEYKTNYRGKVQNRKVNGQYLPMYELSFEKPHSEILTRSHFDREVEIFNQHSGQQPVYIVATTSALNEQRSNGYFAMIDSLSQHINNSKSMKEVVPLLMLRSVAFSSLQNTADAINDLSAILQEDSTSTLAYWLRAVCQSKQNEFQASQGTNIDMKTANVLLDFTAAIRHSPTNPYLFYNRGNVYIWRGDYIHAIEDYTRAIELDEGLAEAFYNRGLARVNNGQRSKGIDDLSKAGELGLYTAYSLIKQLNKK